MNIRLNATLILFLFVSLSIKIQSQVTIGSSSSPAEGALLDLKQDNTTFPSGVTASKGLGLPRVKLSDANKLIMGTTEILDTDGDGNQYKKYVGLIVYNVDDCVLSGDGVYVWDGVKWEPLFKKSNSTSSFNLKYLDLPSGQDLRPLTSQNLIVTWEGGISPTWSMSADGELNAVDLVAPSSAGTVGASPYTMSIQPQAMNTTTEVTATRPWYSKQTKLMFTNLSSNCGTEDYVILNQTNYALMANGAVTDTHINYVSPSQGTFLLEGNAAWKTSLRDPNNVLPSATTPAIGAVDGVERKDGKSTRVNFKFTPDSNTKYYTAYITFSDTARTKRFNDITVSVLNCNNIKDPSIEEWAQRAGFTQAEIAATTGSTDATSSVIRGGYQLHRDQDNNLFISGDFGSAGRWMIVNLAAKTYVSPASSRTGDDKYINATVSPIPNVSTSSANPLWAYPNNTSQSYTNNPRMGLLYNWAAATNGHGQYSITGVELNEGGAAWLTEGETTTGVSQQTNKIQGICPNGWHLPSDREWTTLEQEMSDQTSLYSNLPNSGVDIQFGVKGWRGENSIQGQAMIDLCPMLWNSYINYYGGNSNIISNGVRSGMNLLLTGSVQPDGTINDYGTEGNFWTASGDGSFAWARIVYFQFGTIMRTNHTRDSLFSVRCMKDN